MNTTCRFCKSFKEEVVHHVQPDFRFVSLFELKMKLEDNLMSKRKMFARFVVSLSRILKLKS